MTTYTTGPPWNIKNWLLGWLFLGIKTTVDLLEKMF